MNRSCALFSMISPILMGKEYIDPGHLYTFDLDIFGEHSLFQYINRTSTPVGKEHLGRVVQCAFGK